MKGTRFESFSDPTDCDERTEDNTGRSVFSGI
jgi:hypothetical protein